MQKEYLNQKPEISKMDFKNIIHLCAMRDSLSQFRIQRKEKDIYHANITKLDFKIKIKDML